MPLKESSGVEPIVHFRSVTNTAWLVRSADASGVPMHELAAVCQAVLRPSADVWSRFLTGLGDLVSNGDVSDDESIAVLASEFTHVRLGDFDPEADLEASTVREIVERVRAEQETHLRAELDDEKRRREESERVAAVAEGHAASIVSSLETKAERLAGFAAGAILCSLCAVLVLGGVWSLPTEWSDSTRAHRVGAVVWWICVVSFMGCSLAALFTPRLQVLNLFERLKASFMGRLKRRLLPELGVQARSE